MNKRSDLLTVWLSILIIYNAAQVVQEVFMFGVISWVGEIAKPDSEEFEEEPSEDKTLSEDESFAEEFDELLSESEKESEEFQEALSESETSQEEFDETISSALFTVGLSFFGYLAALVSAGFLLGLKKWAFWGYCASMAFLFPVNLWGGYNILECSWDLGGLIILIMILHLDTPKGWDQLD